MFILKNPVEPEIGSYGVLTVISEEPPCDAQFKTAVSIYRYTIDNACKIQQATRP